MEKAPAGSQWRLNVGRALDVLRRDVAGLFSRRNYTPDFSIYSPEIEVRTCHGERNAEREIGETRPGQRSYEKLYG